MKKKAVLLSVLLILCAILSGCAGKTADAQPAAPSAEPTPEPTPAPTPFMEPEMEKSAVEVWFEGVPLIGGVSVKDGVDYVKLSEVASALNLKVTHEANTPDYAFSWRKDTVSLSAEKAAAVYLGEERELDAKPLPCSGGEDLYVPVESFCRAAEIGFYRDTDEETGKTSYYCTPGAGDWAIPENYNVPVLMYHGVGHSVPDANLIITPERLEEQIVYLLDNGFTPIWFEDLWHVEDFTKPVILTFDDGWSGVYKYMFPLVEKYQVKVSVALIVTSSNQHRENDAAISIEKIEEMMKSPYIRFESHSVNHYAMDSVPEEDIDAELRDSERWITRLVKKEPCVFVYPLGGSTPFVQQSVLNYYKFGVKMWSQAVRANKNIAYNTSDDPTLVYRYFVQRNNSMERFSGWVEDPFKDPAVNNYVSPEENDRILAERQAAKEK